MKTHSPALAPGGLAAGYGVLLGACFFLWPVVAGIPSVPLRFAWIAGAFACAFASWRAAVRLDDVRTSLVLRAVPWKTLGVVFAVLVAYGWFLPPLTFSDEVTIALPGFTVAHRLASPLGWVPVWTMLAVAAGAVGVLMRTGSSRVAGVAIIGMALVACAVAATGMQSGLAMRYPPLVHVVQFLSTALASGSPWLLRVPNALWTCALIATAWITLKEWPRSARIALCLGMMLGPLGWTYRTALFQACGELTLALWLTLLLASRSSWTNRRVLLVGVVGALWVLYRPTGLAPVAASLLLLALLGKRHEAWRAASIIGPVALAWFALSPLYAATYSLVGDESAAVHAGLRTPWLPLIAALRALPMNLHPVGLAALVLSSVLALVLGNRAHRSLLGWAWCVALASSVPQQLLVGDLFTGVARMNVLVLVPLGVSIGCLATMRVAGKIAAASALAALLAVTPFSFARYTQHLRATSADIYRAPTEGYVALPVSRALHHVLQRSVTPTVLAPQYTILDLAVAMGSITLAERNAIIERSASWSPDTPARPVVVQGPVDARYAPNLAPNAEERLRAAREWALGQQHEVYRLGSEEALVVW